jgi:hypothetical protein
MGKAGRRQFNPSASEQVILDAIENLEKCQGKSAFPIPSIAVYLNEKYSDPYIRSVLVRLQQKGHVERLERIVRPEMARPFKAVEWARKINAESC